MPLFRGNFWLSWHRRQNFRNAEVEGSIPFRSTCCRSCRNHVLDYLPKAAVRSSSSLTNYFFSRFGSQSRMTTSPLRSRSDLPLIVSPSTLPLYLVLKVLPLRSNVVSNLTSSSL
jgi:hypothetical protein